MIWYSHIWAYSANVLAVGTALSIVCSAVDGFLSRLGMLRHLVILFAAFFNDAACLFISILSCDYLFLIAQSLWYVLFLHLITYICRDPRGMSFTHASRD